MTTQRYKKAKKYYMGTVQGNTFVRWNGGSGEVFNSSFNILEDILTVKDEDLIKAGGDGWGYSEDHRKYLRPIVEHQTLFYPYGRCIVLSPPSTDEGKLVQVNSLTINFNVDAIKRLNQTLVTLRIYLMEKANSPLLWPHDFDMLGDPIKVNVEDLEAGQQGYYSYFKTKISRSRHVLGDPQFECSEYTEDDSYYDCITSTLQDYFDQELGCVPPLLVTRDEQSMCNRRFNNISDEKLEKLRGIFNKIYFHDIQLEQCKPPCTKTVYHSKRYLQNAPSKGLKVIIMFENSIVVTESRFSINGATLLTRFGGSVSSGRTLLWILLSILALTQVVLSERV